VVRFSLNHLDCAAYGPVFSLLAASGPNCWLAGGPVRREGSGGALSLVVTGSAKPLQQVQRAQQGRQHHLGGQEQVNILNLPLPDFEGGAAGAKGKPSERGQRGGWCWFWGGPD
jgi:hypothetical protein